MTTIKHISWIHSKDELNNYFDSNTFPIFEPENTKRKIRWSKILTQYGISQIEQRIQSYNNKSIDYLTVQNLSDETEKDIIIVFDKNLIELSALYASKTNRILVLLSSVEELNTLFLLKQPNSILFIDFYYNFNTKSIKRISELVYTKANGTKWGIATASDIEGLSFVLAKFLLNKPSFARNGTIDILNKQIFEYEDYKKKVEYKFSDLNINRFISDSWQTLGIVAHGEGAHANLNSVVLCGLIGEQERDINGNILETGCKVNNCKRVHNKGIQSVPVYNLVAEHCILLSCNGFSVAGDLFPSDNSFVLSAAEGHIKNIITTTEVLSFEPEVIEIFLNMIQSKFSLGEIINIHNDIQKNLNGNYPYILFGDPLLNGDYNNRDFPKLNNKKFDIPVDQKVFVRENYPTKPFNVYEIKPSNIYPLFGEKYTLFFNKDMEIPINKVEIIDKTKYLSDLADEVNEIFSSIKQMKTFTNQLFLMNPEIFSNKDNKLGTLYRRVSELLNKLTLCNERFLFHINKVYSSRTFNRVIVQDFWKIINDLTENLYKCFSLLFQEKVISSTLDTVLSQPYYKRNVEHLKKCNRCHSYLNIYELESKLSNTANRILYTCPVCGIIHNYTKHGNILNIESINEPQPGKEFNIRLIFDIKNKISYQMNSYIVGEVTDKSTGKVIHKFIKKGIIESNYIEINIPLPSDIGSDLHTIKVILLSEYDITYTRSRFHVYNNAKHIFGGDYHEVKK